MAISFTFNPFTGNFDAISSVTLAAVGSSPNANSASLTGQILNLEPADGTHPGVLTAGAQTIGGAKAFTAAMSITGSSDTTQLSIIGNATQTNNIIQILSSGFGNLLSLDNSGNLVVGADITAGGGSKVTSGSFNGDNAAQALSGLYNLDTSSLIAFRNHNNNGDLTIGVDASDVFQFSSAIHSSGNITGLNLSGTNTGDVSLGAVGAVPNANGASLSGQVLTLQPADATHPGVLTAADWNTFNGKQAALTIGNLTDAGTDGITVTGGTGAVIGSGTSISQHVADSTHNGYLSSTDWNTFNNKQPAGSYANITLSNLGTTSINADLLPSSDAGHALGSSSLNWSALSTYQVNASNGTKAIELNSSTGRALNAGSTRNMSWGLSSSSTAPGIKYDQATSNGFVKTSAGDGTLAIDTTVYASGTRTINTQSGTTYTAVLADGSGAGGSPIIYFTSGSATTFTIPTNASVAFPVGTQIDISQQGAGKVTVAAAGGVTIHSKGGNLSINGQYVGATLIKDATDTWCLYGDLQA